MQKALALSLSLLLLALGIRSASAETSLDRFGFLNAPLPALPSLPPAPERETEWVRRSFEVVAEAGLALPWCSQSSFAPCASLGTGISASLAGFYRISPYVGLGAEIAAASFRLDEGSGHAGIVGPVFRAYFLEEGSIDPWIQVGFGAAHFRTRHPADLSVEATGPVVSGAAGVDFWLSPSWKLGPAIGQRFLFPTESRGCNFQGCGSFTAGQAGGIRRHLNLGLTATFAFGSFF